MAYENWERDHDQKLIETLRTAKITEETLDNGDVFITLAHLSGRVSFCDGMMYWSVSGMGIGGEKIVDQMDLDRSERSLTNYGRAAVRNNLERIAEDTIKSAKLRLETAQ